MEVGCSRPSTARKGGEARSGSGQGLRRLGSVRDGSCVASVRTHTKATHDAPQRRPATALALDPPKTLRQRPREHHLPQPTPNSTPQVALPRRQQLSTPNLQPIPRRPHLFHPHGDLPTAINPPIPAEISHQQPRPPPASMPRMLAQASSASSQAAPTMPRF